MRIGLCCIAKSEENTIHEWIYYYKKLGFTRIYMYMNDLEYIINDDKVIQIPFPGYNKQVEAYNHFLKHFRHLFDWVAFFDCDEYLVLKQHSNIQDFIKYFDNPCGIAVHWCFFGSDGQEKNHHKSSVIKRFTKRQKGVDIHIKTILNLSISDTYMVIAHHPNIMLMNTDFKYINGPFDKEKKTDDYVQLNHYHHKSLEEWILRIQRGHPDTSPNKSIEQWHKSKYEFCDEEDLFALNFLLS